MITLADPSASWAVLIGAPRYESLPQLPSVSENVSALRRLFTDPRRWGIPAEQCLVPDVTNTDRPLDAVMEALLVATAQATDTLLVYYAGHGLSHPLSGELYLALPAAESIRYSFRALAFEQLRRTLSAPGVRAARRVVIVDCCFSALALDGDMSAPQVSSELADLTAVSGAYVLTACAETEAALAPVGERYTAFTGELIGLLENGINGAPELLDLHTIYRHLLMVLGPQRRPLPHQRSRDLAGDLAIVRNVAWDANSETPDSSVQPGVQLAERVRLLKRTGDFEGAAGLLSEAAESSDLETLHRHIQVLRRAHRHAEAAELVRRMSRI